MKKYILFLFMTVWAYLIQAQCTPGTYSITCTQNYSSTSVCTPNGFSVTGTATLKVCDADPPSWTPCYSSTLNVKLQYWTGSTWSTLTSQTISNGGSYNLSQYPTATLSYRISVSVVYNGTYSPCAYAGGTTYNSGSTTVTASVPASATFKVDGNVVNPTTYTQVYGCSTATAQMDNITWAGTNSGYYWKVEVIRTSDGLTYYDGWNLGTPGGSYNLRNFINSSYGSIPGQYTVKLWVKNTCNPSGSAYVGKIQINNVPVACLQLANNSSTGCNPTDYVNLGTYSSPTATCANSPKLTASCSDGQWVGGYWNLVVWEYDLSDNFIKTVVSTGNQSLTNTSQISCLNLNDWSSPLGYFYSNSSVYKYIAYFVVGNSCGTSVAGGYFRDISSGCKTDGESDVTTIEGNDQQKELPITVYPNPVENELTVEWYYADKVKPSINLYSIDGRLVPVTIRETQNGKFKLDVSNLDRGVYLLELNDGLRRVKKISIQ